MAEGSTYYSAVDGILFDKAQYYLYVYPCGKSGTSYTVPATVKTIGSNAFDRCFRLAAFTVAPDNAAYASDQWGVLYSKDFVTLIQYPSARMWPYYNVSDKTTTILYHSFNSCTKLVNIYIPSGVTTMRNNAIVSCPGLTVCAYSDSLPYDYAGTNNITAWPMENYKLQGIEIYQLPKIRCLSWVKRTLQGSIW